MQWIDLPCQPHDSLDWSEELCKARTLVEQGDRIVWKCNLGLEGPFYPLDDEMRFQSASLAMTRFSEIVWPEFKEHTEFVCLYRGSADFHSYFSWSDKQLTDFARFADPDTLQAKRLFTAESFAIYFRMLSHRLPDEAKVLLLFDLAPLKSPVTALQVISKERFEHFSIGVRGLDMPIEGLWWDGTELECRKIEVTAGVVFPESACEASCEALGKLFTIPGVKIIFESFLSEEWEGLDQLYVIENSLSVQGLRKLSGFRAAGGEVITI
jgi:hypothetical protein